MRNMQNKIKIILSLLLIFSVCLMSLNLISAYFTDSDNAVNTFTVSNPKVTLTEEFVLKEHEILDSDKDGVYELGMNEVISNKYSVYPGVDIPKDPFIRIKKLTDRAYLYVEVVGENNTDISWSVNDNWLETNLSGKNNGTVYVYKGTAIDAVIVTDENLTTYILEGIDGSPNGGVEISDDFTLTDSMKLSFYSYLIQADGFADYIDAFQSSF